jgi:hypothetical protein
MPPAINKCFNANIEVLLRALALVLSFHGCRPPRKEQPEHLTENQFLGQQRYCQRKDHSAYHRHECDRHLHKFSALKFSTHSPQNFSTLTESAGAQPNLES